MDTYDYKILKRRPLYKRILIAPKIFIRHYRINRIGNIRTRWDSIKIAFIFTRFMVKFENFHPKYGR